MPWPQAAGARCHGGVVPRCPVSRRRGTQHRRERARPEAAAVGPVDAWGGWVAAGDGRTVTGRCSCGEVAVIDCPDCGPQCQRCFIGGAGAVP
jgi:hypothetical protein